MRGRSSRLCLRDWANVDLHERVNPFRLVSQSEQGYQRMSRIRKMSDPLVGRTVFIRIFSWSRCSVCKREFLRMAQMDPQALGPRFL